MRTFPSYRKIPMDDSFNEGDLRFSYGVYIFDTIKKNHTTCVCPYDKCKNLEEAIDYYYKKFHGPNKIPIVAYERRGSQEYLQQLSIAS